ncbi:hypothetical protein HNP84_007345 [Thermocatellispora tengchongensis]|uniref:Uncharacterized protein n=1 Tax=Thermocatellispora tengchongensis TaxID=1073253 RepID=A0A840PI67_9ACTN|nr:hypothetical protein [Thermocatellispora tengchongensis]MBB5137593.1 hypothetical protein [Thermocatellispora tengchongensis]
MIIFRRWVGHRHQYRAVTVQHEAAGPFGGVLTLALMRCSLCKAPAVYQLRGRWSMQDLSDLEMTSHGTAPAIPSLIAGGDDRG